MMTFFGTATSVGQNVLTSGIDHVARSPLRDGLMNGTHIEGLMAAGLVLFFMTVALLKPEWMG
jgi:hypothetical protein